jgi:3-deoxy-7-phosphoheptulonate synthase
VRSAGLALEQHSAAETGTSVIVIIRREATPKQRAEIAHILVTQGARSPLHPIRTETDDLFVFDHSGMPSDAPTRLSALPGVERVLVVQTPYQLASRAVHPNKTIVKVGQFDVGGSEPVIIAGPCSVEGEPQILEAARAAKAAGAHLLRGGAFKPRTSPYSFQGLGLEGLEILASAGSAVGMPVVTEVMEPDLVDAVAQRADVLQIGSRNMQNFPLLRAVGRTRRPVLLKRGFAATIDEWLLAAEYILLEGNPHVILCERGIRGFDAHTRNVLDLACVPLLGQLTHLPVIVDPSHATGRRDLVVPLGVAAIAAGADGLMVEMHPNPPDSVSDSEQTIGPEALGALVTSARHVRAALDATALGAPVESSR